jgi:hypothetical protein
LSVPSKEDVVTRLTSKPKRMAVVRLIGEKGEVSFKELKARLDMGVGTLYYHLDAVRDLVTQNETKQYVLTESGKKAYESIKGIEVNSAKFAPRKLPSSIFEILRQIFLFESQLEIIPQDQMLSLTFALGILFTGSILSGFTRIEPAIFFIRSRSALPIFAMYSLMASWAVIFGTVLLLSTFLWKARRNIMGLAAASAISMTPMIFAILLDSFRRTFPNALLDYLFGNPYFLGFQVILVIWAGFLLTFSLRSALNLTIEKALVETLVVVLINFVYLWANPLVIPTLR